MAKYRITFDVRNPNGQGGTTMNATVDADSDFMATKAAENQLKSRNPLHRDYSFNVKKIEKIG